MQNEFLVPHLNVNKESRSTAFLFFFVVIGCLCYFHLGKLHVAVLDIAACHFVALVDLLNQIGERLIDVLTCECTYCEELAVVLGL